MRQLVINDLDFCQTELSEFKGGKWLDIDVRTDVAVVAALPTGLGYGTAFGAAIAMGANADGSPPEATVSVSVEGFKLPPLLPFSFSL